MQRHPGRGAVVALGGGSRSAGRSPYKTGENTTGTTNQCYYSLAGSSYTQTVSSVSLCPLTMEVRTTGTPTPSARRCRRLSFVL